MSYPEECVNALTLVQNLDRETEEYMNTTYGPLLLTGYSNTPVVTWNNWSQSWGTFKMFGMILLSLCSMMVAGSTQLHAGGATTETKKTSILDNSKPPQVTRNRPLQAPPVRMVSLVESEKTLTHKHSMKGDTCPSCKPKQAPKVKRYNPPCSVNCVCGCNEGLPCTCNQKSKNHASAVITGEPIILTPDNPGAVIYVPTPVMQYSEPLYQSPQIFAPTYTPMYAPTPMHAPVPTQGSNQYSYPTHGPMSYQGTQQNGGFAIQQNTGSVFLPGGFSGQGVRSSAATAAVCST